MDVGFSLLHLGNEEMNVGLSLLDIGNECCSKLAGLRKGAYSWVVVVKRVKFVWCVA